LEQISSPLGSKDFGNDRVVRWPGQGRSPWVEVVAGGRGEGDGLEQLAGPVALALQETKGADGQQMGMDQYL